MVPGAILVSDLLALGLFPNTSLTQSLRDVVISEIAWMGTTESFDDEWIEPYNNTGSSIDLSNWTSSAKDGIPSITLAGSIPAGGTVSWSARTTPSCPSWLPMVPVDSSEDGSQASSDLE